MFLFVFQNLLHTVRHLAREEGTKHMGQFLSLGCSRCLNIQAVMCVCVCVSMQYGTIYLRGILELRWGGQKLYAGVRGGIQGERGGSTSCSLLDVWLHIFLWIQICVIWFAEDQCFNIQRNRFILQVTRILQIRILSSLQRLELSNNICTAHVPQRRDFLSAFGICTSPRAENWVD